ncbi:MAG: FAD-dependent oxidoreductase [Desulfobacterales bacterium]|nr:FAD-dependent oxidoreductase [Desulfobacterales bacterium]
MFKNLFNPGKIGEMEVKNRFILAPMYVGSADADGFITQRTLDYYAERAKGGVGLAIVEYSYIDDKASKSVFNQIAISRDEMIPGLSKLSKAIKENGARAGIQLSHTGGCRMTLEPSVSPSGIPVTPPLGGMAESEELTVEGIKEIVESFARAAGRAKQAGFDMIELHGAHGYLITEFFSRHANKRTDAYGGTLHKRMRFGLEVVEAVRNQVGKDYPLGIRISGTDYDENGITLDESIEFAKELESAGVDIIHVSGSTDMIVHKIFLPIYYPRAFNVYLAEGVRKAVSKVPIIATGGITTPDLAEEILAAGKADFVALAKPLLADPYLPLKAKEGRVEDIRPCIRCMQCYGTVLKLEHSKCSVNPEVGIEYDQNLEPVKNPKNIAVIGGGPAGMEAARVAALRGHAVTLYEKRDRLGGYMNESSISEHKVDIRWLITYFETQLEKLGVTIKHEDGTLEAIERAGFDAVIVATGSTRVMPDYRGIDRPFVMDVVDAYHKRIGQSAVILADRWEVGCCEIALYFAEQGKEAKVIFVDSGVETIEEVSFGINPASLAALMDKIGQNNIEMRLVSDVEEITDKGAVVVDKNGEKYDFEADTVVVVPTFVPDKELAKELQTRGKEVYVAGDCVEIGTIYEAVHTGHQAGRQV